MRLTVMLIAAAAAAGVAACNKPTTDAAPATSNASNTVASDTAAQTIAEPEEWEGCAKLKEELAEATTKFADAAYGGPIETWRLNMFGMNFALPRGEWDVLPTVVENGGVTAVLVERNTGDTVVWSVDPIASPKVHEQLVLGHQHTASDLTCAKSAQKREAPIAAALALKDIDAPGTTIAMHHDLNAQDDVARFSSLDDQGQWQWEVWLPSPRGYVQATYRFKDEGRARAFAGQPTVVRGNLPPSEAEAGPPQWMGLLEQALADPASAALWEALLADRKKSDASGKSISALEALAAPKAP